ncbi:MAG TPA: molybdenum cofactor guanylyltransferase [Ktedonobacterales bacterium]|nr:molybdenum cofactor guanylyltransferase [Ktedonobacterales bacterium]
MSGSAGAILAGGKSSRMGENKAAMVIAGETLLHRLVRRLSTAVDEVLVIGPETLMPLISPSAARIVPDIVPMIGPLGGLYTALKATVCDRVFLMACDMPFVQPGLVRAMLALAGANPIAKANPIAEAVVIPDGQRAQPLHAVYTKDSLPAIEQALAADDHSLRALLAHLSVVPVSAEIISREDPHGISTFNVNTPADWQRALLLARELEPSER